MKYKTFRLIAVASGIATVAGAGYFLLGSSTEPARNAVEATAPPPSSIPAAQPAPAPAPTAAPDYRTFLLSRLGTPAHGDKLKDAVPGPAKVNVYAKNGTWDRAKVDFDRDEKWDEKWWVKDGKILREASSDDGDHHGKGTVEGIVTRP